MTDEALALRVAAYSKHSGRNYIYALVDPRDLTVRYVGKTTCPELRIEQHMDSPTNWSMRQWFDEVIPEMHVLQLCSDAQWEDAERGWIAYFRKRARLYNIHPGGKIEPRDTNQDQPLPHQAKPKNIARKRRRKKARFHQRKSEQREKGSRIWRMLASDRLLSES